MRKLDAINGLSWSHQNGLIRLKLWAEDSTSPFDIYMTPHQLLYLIEDGAHELKETLKDQFS